MQPEQKSAVKVPNLTRWHLSKVVRYAPLHLAAWMTEHRATYPRFFYNSAVVSVGIVMACLALSLLSQVGAQVMVGIVFQAGIGICVIGFVAVMFTMTVGTYQAARHSFSTAPETLAALPERTDTWQPPSIAPDILVCLQPGESLEAFKKRVQDIQNSNAITHAIWAVVIFPFQSEVMVVTPDEPFIWTRGNESFFETAQEWAGTIDHQSETVETYRKYVEFFCHHYIRWVTAEKIALHQKGAAQILTEKIATTVEFPIQ